MSRSKRALIFLFFGMGGAGNLFAQNPFEISLTGIKTDIYQKGIVALDDGGFVTKEIITTNTKNNSYSIVISRLEPCLGVKWAKVVTSTLFTSNTLRGYLPCSSKIIKANNNGFLLVYTDADPGEDCIVLKLDSAGNQVWSSKIHTGIGSSYPIISSLTCSGVNGHGYAVGGIYSGTPFMVRLTEDGKPEWSKIYLGGAFRQMSRILTFSDSSFMVLFPGDESQTMRLDMGGNVLWAREDNDDDSNRAYIDFDINDAVVDKNDFIYAIGNFNDMYPALMKMDKNGNEIWEYSYGSIIYYKNNCVSIALTKGNKIVLSNSDNTSANTTFIEADTSGHVVTAKTVPNITLNAYQNGIQLSDLILDAMADSGFAFIGTDINNGSLIAKADKYGVIGCNSTNFSVKSVAHVSLFRSLTVSATAGYSITDTSISLGTAKNKASMICSSNYYPFADLGGNQVICSGSTFTLNAGAYIPAFKYLWNTGDTTFSIVANKTGTYWVQISHNSCSSSDTANIIFKDEIMPGLDKKYSICPYDSIRFVASPSPFVNYYWSLPGTKSIVNGDTLWAKNEGLGKSESGERSAESDGKKNFSNVS